MTLGTNVAIAVKGNLRDRASLHPDAWVFPFRRNMTSSGFQTTNRDEI